MSNLLNPRSAYHLQLLKQLQQRLLKASEAITPETIATLDSIVQAMEQQLPDVYEQGQDWLSHLATHQPQLVPAIERDLFWFFGGSCLHTLTDEEIERFQQLDEQEAEALAAGQTFDRHIAKQNIFAG